MDIKRLLKKKEIPFSNVFVAEQVNILQGSWVLRLLLWQATVKKNVGLIIV